MNPVDRLKTLLSVDSLVVAGALGRGPADSAALAGLVGFDRQDVLRALGPLVHAGIVSNADGVYALDREMLRSISFELAEPALAMDPSIGFGMTDEEQTVLANYFEARALISLPTSRAKRLIVLERLALEFDVGKKYPEEEVNSILGAFNPDWSMLRRHLVNEGMLDRERNVYWRSGGRVPGVYRG